MKNIAFFDSECITCNTFVNFILKIDKREKIVFSKINGKVYHDLNINSHNIDSIVYKKKNKEYYYTDAIIEILKDSHFLFNILSIQYLIPLKIRKSAYIFFAKRRKKNLNKTCQLHLTNKDRFI